MWGNSLLRDFLFRENSVKPAGEFTASARYPSSLISQIQGVPSGSFDTGKHSIGSINDACVLGKDAERACIFRWITFFRKTKPGQISNARVRWLTEVSNLRDNLATYVETDT